MLVPVCTLPDDTALPLRRTRRPEELLQHELCEEVVVAVPVRGGEVASATVFRGPRLKTGIDIGPVVAQLHTITGRMTYRGKVMNRAARISAAASSGQVGMWVECRVLRQKQGMAPLLALCLSRRSTYR